MKIIKIKSVLAGILLCCWLALGCEKEEIVPDLKGDIIGYMRTLDEYSVLLSDHSGVKITTRGLDGSYTAYTDETGRYEFSNVPAGTYELAFSKQGFKSDTLRNVKHLGGQPTILSTENQMSMNLYKLP